MSDTTTGPEMDTNPPPETLAEFAPSPVLTAMQDRTRRLARNARAASMFKPRLRRRAAVATLTAGQREAAERQRWDR